MDENEKRAKLETTIEKHVHAFVEEIRESTYDKVHLYVRRNKIEVDYNVVELVLKISRDAINESELAGMDKFMTGVSGALDQYVPKEIPLEPILSSHQNQKSNPSLLKSSKEVKLSL